MRRLFREVSPSGFRKMLRGTLGSGCARLPSTPVAPVAAAARRTAARAEGSEHIKVRGTELGAEAMGMVAELRALGGASSLAAASGKLAVLDRLLVRKKAQGSRVLLFSQYTLALDVLEEYCENSFGRAGYLRLDGATNRIDREMDVRSFNVAGSRVFIYLISTRAGGQGINLATADTVVLYDTCWNPQVDLQARPAATPCLGLRRARFFFFFQKPPKVHRGVRSIAAVK